MKKLVCVCVRVCSRAVKKRPALMELAVKMQVVY